jgi:predicted nucleotide-binding protein
MSKKAISKDSKKVFIVHGHDNEIKETVARFTEKLGLEPIVLHEQPSKNQTIIEKFERNSDVAFAIVLLTPDDVAVAKNNSEKIKDRARQNVIFEMGYFIGRLGRGNVCAITKGDIEIPSDYSGIIYIPFDGNSWKLELVKELKEVGLKIDANDAF